MSTRCVIGYRTKENKVIYSYCHFDGHPEGVGKILLNHYNNEEKALALSSLHGFSSLEPDYENTKNNEYNDSAQLYGVMSHHEWISTASLFGADFTYLWQHGHWFVQQQYSSELEYILNKIEQQED